MPGLFSRFRSRDGSKKSKKNGNLDDLANQLSVKKWDDASTRKSVEPEEIQELIRRCTEELKSRGMSTIEAVSNLGMTWILHSFESLLAV